LVKRVKVEVENCKVSIRNSRREGNEELKKLNKEGLSDDSSKTAEDKVQAITNNYISKIDSIFEVKEKDILTV
jgi:ribosome recycling factor